ncbi:unnamed protein product [Peronospora effusa]|uniref:Plastocyanin-like domain-containing protein n=1 Tax=Peronospora effusa TaxID=542832 RepID=A0A3R7XU92_9STRA|nr:hypothetical protein DD237_008214 [Peronospora effusa]CAI5703796.1 unnamed protein product [Peronospora effusa]
MVGLLSLPFETSAADVVTFDWRVTHLFTEYDGVFIDSFGINDKPSDQAIIEVELGQEVEVRVTNELNESTCLHWHGMKQLGTQEMDGVSGLTQCHISPNGTAVYRFCPDKAGSFWWHSHSGLEFAFGLRGPLIVHAPPNARQDWEIDIDDEFIITLVDLYHREPFPKRMFDNILINNRGRYSCAAAAHHNFTKCTDDQPLVNFHFQPGKKYLLRLINMAALSPIVFSIDGHEFRVVAADGDYLQPSELINSIRLNTGQRYDIIVETISDSMEMPIGPFWMRALGLHGLPWTRGDASVAGEGFVYDGRAIVTYGDGNYNAEPTSTQATIQTTVNEFEFVPLVPTTLPEVASDRAVLQLKMQDGKGYFSIDGSDFHHFEIPYPPPLFSIADGLKTEQLPITANARKIEHGKHIEVVLVNAKDEQHPFHLHTHSPWVVGWGVASLDQIYKNELPPLKLGSAMLRDVYTVPPCTSDGNNGCIDAGYVVLRFNADNPGVWIFHCHIDFHLEAGLSMMLVEGEEELQQRGVKSFAKSMLSVCGSNTSFSSIPPNPKPTS